MKNKSNKLTNQHFFRIEFLGNVAITPDLHALNINIEKLVRSHSIRNLI